MKNCLLSKGVRKDDILRVVAPLKDVIFALRITSCCITILLFGCQQDTFQQTKALFKGGKMNWILTQPAILATNFVQQPLGNDSLRQANALVSKQLQNCCGVYVVQVKFANLDTATYCFVLDTGSPTVISSALARRLGLTVEWIYEDAMYKSYPRLGVTTIKNLQLPIKRLIEKKGVKDKKKEQDSLQWIDFEEIGTVIDSFPPHSFLAGYDGVIGANVMQSTCWLFDGKQKQVQLLDPTSAAKQKQSHQKVPFFRNIYRVPKFHAFVNQYETKQVFHLSTGFGGGVKLPLFEKKRLPTIGIDTLQFLPKEEFAICKTNYIIGKEMQGNPSILVFQGFEFKISNFSTKNVQGILSLGRSWQVGNQVLQNYSLLIDWQEKYLYWKDIPH